jgi:hypothetical protein
MATSKALSLEAARHLPTYLPQVIRQVTMVSRQVPGTSGATLCSVGICLDKQSPRSGLVILIRR